MTRRVTYLALAACVLTAAAVYPIVANQMAAAGAAALLHPARRPVTARPPAGCAEEVFQGAAVRLSGWTCRAAGPRRGTLVFLHGVGDNRAGVAGAVERLARQRLDVIAYDSRAQGNSEGTACTYGYREKADLRKVIDAVNRGPIVLLGASLGAAVALQEAASDGRVAGVVAAEPFSDLRTVARERAPWFFTGDVIRRAFAIAEERGEFRVDDVSPVTAAHAIHVPVLLIHGERDRDTAPDHSRRIFAALAGPKELVIVPGAAHNESLSTEAIWLHIARWIDRTLDETNAR